MFRHVIRRTGVVNWLLGWSTFEVTTTIPESTHIFVGLMPGDWNEMRQSRAGGVLTLKFRGVKPGEYKLTLTDSSLEPREPVSFPVTFL